jgi:hypothetical protein
MVLSDSQKRMKNMKIKLPLLIMILKFVKMCLISKQKFIIEAFKQI